MSALSRWLLIPPVSARLSERYQGYRRHGASPFSAALGCLWTILAWIVFPLEHPRWQRIRAGHKALYPHINAARPRPLDPARYLIQTLWLVMISSAKERHEPRWRSFARLQGVRGRYHQWMDTLPERVRQKTTHLEKEKELGHLSNAARRFILGVIVTFSLILALICITQPFNPLSQFIFLVLLWGVALLVRRMPGRFSALMLIVLSLTVSCRYIWWRYTSTLNWDDPVSLVCGLILLFAETYAWIVLVLGYFQVVWPLNRQPVPLPKEMSQWPTVDIFVPTYNEDLNVVKNTIYASLGIDWPKDKLNIWILDDGGRESFRQFARHVGVHYIARATHEHAKAGNINNALKHAKGEFVAIFDCDHVPTRSFLQMTMGWFLKEKQLAMMQTPHHFFSPDPFERNLGRFRKTPNEGTLFYGLVQDGNDMWDATFFCGSCAVIRRKPLDEIGGIAVETVTEDAHTSLRLHRRGYTSAYMRIPQAAGLATESLSAHIGQRIRWARGMVQIFRLDNPLFGKGLKLAQRLCYLNAMFHFLSGIPRLIFLTAPLAFLLLHAYIIYAPALMIALFVLPHMIHASLTNSKIQGKYRHSFWSEIYETVLAWYIAPPTLVALINPHKGKFNVTAKGGLVEEKYVDWVISRPYIFLVLLNLLGVAAGVWRYYYGPENETLTVIVSLVWVFYNLVILGGAVAVSVESKQVRRAHRVEIAMPGAIAREDGHLFSCTVHDFSDGGLGIKINGQAQVLEGQKVNLLLKRGQQEYVFPTQVVRVTGNEVGLQLMPLTTKQHIDFVQCTFARADTWALWQDSFPEDKPLESLLDILKLGFRGYRHLAEFAPPSVKVIFRSLTALIAWIVSFIPRRPERQARYSRRIGLWLRLNNDDNAMKRKLSWICAAVIGLSAFPAFMTAAAPATPPLINAEPTEPAPANQAPVVAQTAPSREVKLTFAQIAPPPGSMALRGVNPNGSIEFGMRSDEVASKAVLNLEYTPSPSLLPVQSQLKVYLNDELMGVLPVTKEQLGKKTLAQVPINPLFITDFNRVRLEFVGHYRDVCENPASSTLWLDIGRNSALDLTYSMLAVNNDLSHFPVPFFDPRDNRPVTLPMVFADVPDLAQQQAASIVASWFGSRAGWRGQRFPVLYNHLPDRNAIVFATNDRRPDFLRDHPAVNAPVIEMMNHPDNPYVKLLVVFGRDDKDLLQAAKGIAQGNILFRGSSVVVNDVKPLLARKPYDAPNWVRTDRPVTFGELKTYEEQLQSSGLEPAPINVSLNLPPDLYLLRSNGIDMDLNYRYTSPPTKDSSRLDISLNNQFLQAFSLSSTQETNRLLLRLPVLQGLLDGKTDVSIPALKLGAMNQLRFDFQYMNPMPGGSVDNCITFQPVQNHVVIGDDSTIDFSKYYHFIAMPDLRAFANAGFPFSRMADLSYTLAVMPKTPTEAQMETLLNTVGAIGGQTGFPAINLTITDNSAQIADKDADLLIIGAIPDKLKDDKRIDLLVQATQSWVKTPMRQTAFPSIMPDEADRAADAQSTVTASGPMAAAVGFQSPFNDQRSVIALLADSPRGYQLLNDAMNDSGKRAAMFGSVAVIRESGVHSLRVGDIYYVGHLPWFERLWYALANHPVLLAVLAAISVVLLAWVLWRLLRILSRRRLDPDHE
ncbi:Cellulose biosynthesis protein catalytic subunit A [Salmonella enterica subsp. arizonae]|nr:Cellulose biosynthesis protein catalytic subunit A [Salmonella enterica subsp. arizonae]